MKTARQEILGKLSKAKHAVPEPPDFEDPVYFSTEEPLETTFKKTLESVNGKVHLCTSGQELAAELKKLLSLVPPGLTCCTEPEIQLLLDKYHVPYQTCKSLPEKMEAGITGCELLIAHTGSVMVSSAQKGGRQMFVYPPVHVIIAEKKQLVGYLDEAYRKIRDKYPAGLPSQIILITGPSRTADIEKTLILGAHGPKELHVFLY